jgi:hypothetical protein
MHPRPSVRGGEPHPTRGDPVSAEHNKFDVFHLVVHIQLKITKHSPTQLFIYSITAMFQGDMFQLDLLSHHQAYAVT